MTTRAGFWAIAAALIAAPAPAQPAAPPSPASEDALAPEVAELAQSCSAHKFETTVKFTVDGKQRQSKVKMCGTVGQTDAQWATTLRDAAKKIQANDSMTPEARQQVVAAIQVELIKIESAMASIAPATTLTLPREVSGAAPVATGRLPEYSALPPLPAPLPAVAASAGALSAAVARPLPPRLTIRCIVPTDLRDPEPCSTIEARTLLDIRADENLPAGLQLRFMRKGDDRGSLRLAAMRAGQRLRLRPPSKLCAGVIRSRAEIQIVTAGGQVVDTRGPLDLSC